MFTGLIHYTGKLAARDGSCLTIEVPAELRSRIDTGDSVAVNGVCLTAVRLGESTFEADLLPATLQHTTLGRLPLDSVLNLEPALRAGDPLGGHLVHGHVDGTTTVFHGFNANEGYGTYMFEMPEWLENWVVPKGSICIDGVSLTVQYLSEEKHAFAVELIPETLARTNLGSLQPGQRVNLEADLIVKTISELMRKRQP